MKEVLKKIQSYSKPCEKYKIELFVKIVEGFQTQITFVKDSTLDVWPGSKYDFEPDMGFWQNH